jgi:16S rRNA (cytosine1402-N4)-methyltransferase
MAEVLTALSPVLRPGAVAVDCTLGYGGHTAELLSRIAPGGRLYAFDADGEELSKTVARLRSLGYDEDALVCTHANYAAAAKTVLSREPGGVDALLADLGCSSMQLDDPRRGFGYKRDGPLDMRLDTSRGQPASELLREQDALSLEAMLTENSDEPHAQRIAQRLCARGGPSFDSTVQLADAVRAALPSGLDHAASELSVRRVFQAIRIAVNKEFDRLDALLVQLPLMLKPGGRAAVISFHSGEDRRVKAAFKDGILSGVYAEASGVVRPSLAEQRGNPRAACAKLRWAQRSPA